MGFLNNNEKIVLSLIVAMWLFYIVYNLFPQVTR